MKYLLLLWLVLLAYGCYIIWCRWKEPMLPEVLECDICYTPIFKGDN